MSAIIVVMKTPIIALILQALNARMTEMFARITSAMAKEVVSPLTTRPIAVMGVSVVWVMFARVEAVCQAFQKTVVMESHVHPIFVMRIPGYVRIPQINASARKIPSAMIRILAPTISVIPNTVVNIVPILEIVVMTARSATEMIFANQANVFMWVIPAQKEVSATTIAMKKRKIVLTQRAQPARMTEIFAQITAAMAKELVWPLPTLPTVMMEIPAPCTMSVQTDSVSPEPPKIVGTDVIVHKITVVRRQVSVCMI